MAISETALILLGYHMAKRWRSPRLANDFDTGVDHASAFATIDEHGKSVIAWPALSRDPAALADAGFAAR